MRLTVDLDLALSAALARAHPDVDPAAIARVVREWCDELTAKLDAERRRAAAPGDQ